MRFVGAVVAEKMREVTLALCDDVFPKGTKVSYHAPHDWNGGLVKITLRPGQSLSWETRGPTDEGWSAEGYTWTHAGDVIECEGWSDGRDCDGRLSSYAESVCSLDELQAGNEPYAEDCEGIRYPRWERVDAGQRDYQAELAGY